jgi:xanthine dehydrogenase small subunit
MNSKPIRFLKSGQVVTLHDVPPTRTLLEVLREDMHCTGTKEGCGEGDCGACTVVVGENVGGKLQTRAINSCIRMAHSVDGMALWTVEDLSGPNGDLHPVQEAMVQCHASQCGFCTPGFVMSLFALHRNHQGKEVTREQAQGALSGNLCRCTGYRPILDAAVAMQKLPQQRVDEKQILAELKQLQSQAATVADPDDPAYLSPTTLRQLLHDKAKYPQAQLVAGCTDVGLWVTKMHMQFERVIDTTQVAELRRTEYYPHHIAIGAAVPLTDAFAALVANRPQLGSFAHRFAGLPVRNSGTLGGNVANGSPIGDSMPLLIALGANVVLMRAHKGRIQHREMPLEALYTGYRKNVMGADEVLAWIKVPKAVPQEVMRVYKISKRHEDDISAVCLAVNLWITDGVITKASIGVGGVAATPVRAVKTESALGAKQWNPAIVQAAATVLRGEFSPISDMRATAAYRSAVLGNLLQRFWLESQGIHGASLEDIAIVDEPISGASA